jgi:glycosyltransferase involved in cell wall biosynthesis
VATFDPRQMRELYRAARVVVLSVLPTERACGMNVVGEAWAMRRPVVATATSGMSEYIVDEVSGKLVPPGDALALRAALGSVLADDACAQTLADGGYDQVRSTLSLERFDATIRWAIERSRASG